MAPENASATYPGRNGLIGYENAPDRFGDIDEIDAVVPQRTAPLALVVCPTLSTITRHFSDPAWAPDGTSFAFSTFEQCGTTHPCCASTITIARADGSIVSSLPRLTSHDRSPQFLPSGKRLVFAGRDNPGSPYDLYTVSVSGSGLHRLTTTGADDPAPCPNGTIAYVHDGDIYLLAADGLSHRLIARVHGFFPVTAGLSCSPDSRLIAFVRDRDRFSPGDLYVASAKGGAVRRITSGRFVIATPSFSPAGGFVALAEQHRNTRQWPRPKSCGPGLPYSYYLEVVDLKDRRPYAPVDIGCNSAPGGISWQPLHGSARPAIPWHGVGRIDRTGLSAIACPIASLCVASDVGGRLLSATRPTDGTSAWNASDVDGASRLTDVACPSGTLCVAIDADGNVVTSRNPAGGASAWAPAHVDGANTLTSVSCPSTNLCVAVDGVGNAVTSTNPGGGAAAWMVGHIDTGTTYECSHNGLTGPTCQPGLTAVSCPSPVLCVAVDDAGDRLMSSNPAGGPSAWSLAHAGPVPASMAPDGLSCPSKVLCVASDSYAGEIVTWNPTRPQLPDTVATITSNGLAGVACASSVECFASAYDGRLFGSANPTSDAAAWRLLYTGHAEVSGLVCPSVAPCLAVDNAGQLLVGPPLSSATGPAAR